MCQFLVSTRGEVLHSNGVSKAQLNESSAVESVFPLPICRWSQLFYLHRNRQSGPMVSPNVALQDVFQFHKGPYTCFLFVNLVTYNTRMRNKTTSATFLALAPNSTFLVQGQTLEPDDQLTIPLFASLNHLMELCILDFRHYA